MRKNEGITLVALVITIIVLIILAGVTISLLIGENGIITKAKEGKINMANAQTEEEQGLENLANEMDNAIQNNTQEEVKIEVDGKEVGLTKENLATYLGRAVDYTPKSPSSTYATSTTYRLFYVDFDNDFKDGAGTIYLKADCDGKNVNLSSHTSYTSTDRLAIMKKVNPEWAATTDATTLQTNGHCVSWIADPNNWNGTNTSAINYSDDDFSGNINYIIGSPSLEMYVKSYNVYLSANPTLKDNGGTNLAKQLECKYVSPGYKIGLVGDNYATNSGNYTADNILISSTNAMYNPGSDKYFWLASPSAASGNTMMAVNGIASSVSLSDYNYSLAFCPLVSLKSSVKLTLTD